MKMSVVELSLRIEDWIDNELKKIGKGNLNSSIIENENVEMNQVLNVDDVYQVLVFETEDNTVITNNTEEYKNIIKQLESKRSIASRYNRMLNALLKSSPELFDNEVESLKPYTRYRYSNVEYIVAFLICVIVSMCTYFYIDFSQNFWYTSL